MIADWIEVAKALWKLGHAPEFEAMGEAFLRWALNEGEQVLLRRYQIFHGLPATGQLDAGVTSHLARPRCAHPDVMPLAWGLGAPNWGLSKLRYFQQIAYPGVDPARVEANYLRATRLISAVCGMQFEPTSDPSAAQILARTATIDGQWNVLALSELPPTRGYTGVLHQTFDRAEQLDDDTMTLMMAHELGHILGAGHSGPGNLMAPTLDRAIKGPQPGDVAVFQALCGPPAPSTPTAPPAAAGDPSNPSVSCEPFELDFTVPAAGEYRLTFTPTLCAKVSP
jgi:hypothetical protein